jgi:hypothetical protein
MYHQNSRLLVSLITPFFGVIILFLPTIPTLEDAKLVFSIIIWLLSFILSFLLFKKPKNLSFRKKRILIFIYLLLSSALFLFISFIVLISSAFDAPSIETLASKDYPTTIYLYNYTCSPPDTSTGCGTYHGELKFRISFTPFMITKWEQYLTQLAALGRIDEVMSAAQTHMDTVETAFALAKILREEGYLSETLEIAQAGLNL